MPLIQIASISEPLYDETSYMSDPIRVADAGSISWSVLCSEACTIEIHHINNLIDFDTLEIDTKSASANILTTLNSQIKAAYVRFVVTDIDALCSLQTNAFYLLSSTITGATGASGSIGPTGATGSIGPTGATGTAPITTSSTLTVSGSTVDLTSGIVTAGTYGSASLIPSITLDTYGRVTNISTNSPADAGSVYAKALLYNQTTLITAVTFNVGIPAISGTNGVEILGSSCSPNGWNFGPTSISAPVAMSTNGRLTYTGITTKTFLVTASISGNFDVNPGILLEIRKNGSRTGLTNNFYYSGANSGVAIIPLSVAITLSTNDYISIFISRSTAMGAGAAIFSSQMELINAG